VIDLLLANWLPLILFLCAGLLAFRRTGLSSVLSMAFGAAAVLAALVWGWTLEQVLTGVLLPCAVSLVPLTGKEADL